MSLRPIKHLGTGAFKELLTSEEDYLAYRAGVHLGKMTTSDLSALSVNDQATLVGRYENTYHTGGTETPAGRVISRNFEVILSSNPGASTHSATFDDLFIPLPSVVYVGDTLVIGLIGNATSTGTGLSEIEFQLGLSGNAGYTIRPTTADPVSANIIGLQTSWEDYATNALKWIHSAFYTIEFTDTGVLNFNLNATSTDNTNALSTATDSIEFNSIRVEPQERPITTEDVYELYQNDASVASASTETTFKKNPFYWDRTQSPPGLKEMNDTELDAVCLRLLQAVFTNEYPGNFRLASVAPGDEWREFIPEVFTDTRGDGSTITYSIWIKSFNEIIPSKVAPVYPARVNGEFAGIRELSDAEVEFTFGERMKSLIQSSGIGTYQLRSSLQGPPTEAGVWESRGFAVDTTQSFKEAETYIGTTPFEINYSTGYVATYEGDYEVDYVADYDGTYVGDYVSDYAGDYIGAYEGTYIAIYQGDYEQNYLGDYEAEYIQNYLGNFAVPYVGNFTRNFIEDEYLGDTLITYQGDYLSTFEGEYVGDFPVTYLGDYVRTYQTVVTETFQGQYITEYAAEYEAGAETEYIGNFTETYAGEDTGGGVLTYVGDYISEYVGNSEITYLGNYQPDGYIRTREGTAFPESYIGTYTGATYIADYLSSYEGDYIKTTIADYIGDYEASYTSGEFTIVSGATVDISEEEGDEVYNYSFGGTLSGSGIGFGPIPSYGEQIGTSGYYRGDGTGTVGEYEVLESSSGVYEGPGDTATYTGDQESFTQPFIGDYTSGETITATALTAGYSGIIEVSAYFDGGTKYDWRYVRSSPYQVFGGRLRQTRKPNFNELITTLGVLTSAYEAGLRADLEIRRGSYQSAYSNITIYSAILVPKTNTVSYINTYEGDTYLRDFLDSYLTTYIGNYEGAGYTGDYQGTYTGQYIPTFDGLSYVADYIGEYTAEFEDTYESAYLSAYDGDTFETYVAADYVGDFTETYLGGFVTDYISEYATTYIDDDYIGDIITEYIGNYISEYIGDFSEIYTQAPYIGNFQSDYEGNFQVSYIQDYVGDFLETYEDESATIDYIAETYITEFQSDYASESYQGNYFGDYVGAEDFEAYLAEYVGETYETDYEGGYEGASYIFQYLTGYDAETYQGEYSNPYTVNEVEVSYIDDEVLTSKPITLETYTLYVRIANEVTNFTPLGADALITLDGLTLVVR